jgi:hypothetical protein
MNYRKALGACLIGILASSPSAWSQLKPEANPENSTSLGSLLVQSQHLTEHINRAKSQGRDTSSAEAERSQAEKAIQEGDDSAALRHFRAGERTLE